MVRCSSKTKNSGKRCGNSALANSSKCRVHSSVSMRFKDPVSGKQIENTIPDIIKLGHEHHVLLQALIKKHEEMPRGERKDRIVEQFNELRNRYHIDELKNLLEIANIGLEGQEAIVAAADTLNITPRHLINLVPEVANFEDINVRIIRLLLTVVYSRATIEMFMRNGITV